MTTETQQLVMAHANLVRYLAKQHFPKAPIDQEDLVQEGMIGMIKAAETYNPSKGGFGSYGGRAALNAMINACKRCRKSKEIPVGSKVGFGLADPSPGPEEQAIDAEERACMRSLIDQLPPKMRDIVKLRIDEELTQARIGQILGGYTQAHISKLLIDATCKMQNSTRRYFYVNNGKDRPCED